MRIDRRSHPIASLIDGFLKANKLDSRLRENLAMVIWNEVVGERISNAAQPDNVRDGVIFVKTKSPTWANELTFYKDDIIERLNARLGDGVIKNILFKSGRIKKVEKQPLSEPIEGTNEELIELTDDEAALIENSISAAGEASDELRRLMIEAFRLDKWRRLHGWTPCRICGCLQNEPSGICMSCMVERY